MTAADEIRQAMIEAVAATLWVEAIGGEDIPWHAVSELDQGLYREAAADALTPFLPDENGVPPWMARVDRVHVHHPSVEGGRTLHNMIPEDGPLYRIVSAVAAKSDNGDGIRNLMGVEE
jgi:hypothetical protein